MAGNTFNEEILGVETLEEPMLVQIKATVPPLVLNQQQFSINT
jgi:hypothetical protein